MNKVILHIGLHKTGTTALQTFLFDNADLLSEKGISYFTRDRKSKNHHFLAAMFRGADSNRDNAQRMVEEIMTAANHRRVIISSEILCEGNVDIVGFLSLFQPYDFQAIAYIRHPCDLTVSAFNERVRDPNARRTEPIESLPLSYDPSLRYALGEWVKTGNLTLCPYDRKQWFGGNIYSDFLHQIGVDGSELKIPENERNVSLPFLFIEAIRILNASGIDEKSRTQIIDILRQAHSNPEGYAMSADGCLRCVDALAKSMPTYRPFLREGFDESFLFEKR